MLRSIWFWLVLLLIWLIIGWWFFKKYICTAGDACSHWKVKDGSKEIFESDYNIKYTKDNYSHLIIKNEGIEDKLKKTVQYLKDNTKKVLTVEGYHADYEKGNHPILPNLGYARAADVKNWLVRLGAPSSQIETTSTQRNTCFKNDTLRRGVDFNFGGTVDNTKRLGAIKNRLFGKPITLYFQTGSDKLSLSGQQRQDFSDLFYYLDRVKGSKLDVHGHTDADGDAAANLQLSKDRASQIREYIKSNGGVSIAKMDADGFGPNKPIQPNDSPENKALNRRVEVILK